MAPALRIRIMIWSMATLTKLVAAMTLVIAVFVVVPVADAAACVPEAPSSHQTVNHDPADGDHSGPEHGVCSHGHCHQTASERPSFSDFDGSPMIARPRHDWPRDDFVGAFATDGPMRPPRA